MAFEVQLELFDLEEPCIVTAKLEKSDDEIHGNLLAKNIAVIEIIKKVLNIGNDDHPLLWIIPDIIIKSLQFQFWKKSKKKTEFKLNCMLALGEGSGIGKFLSWMGMDVKNSIELFAKRGYLTDPKDWGLRFNNGEENPVEIDFGGLNVKKIGWILEVSSESVVAGAQIIADLELFGNVFEVGGKIMGIVKKEEVKLSLQAWLGFQENNEIDPCDSFKGMKMTSLFKLKQLFCAADITLSTKKGAIITLAAGLSCVLLGADVTLFVAIMLPALSPAVVYVRIQKLSLREVLSCFGIPIPFDIEVEELQLCVATIDGDYTFGSDDGDSEEQKKIEAAIGDKLKQDDEKSDTQIAQPDKPVAKFPTTKIEFKRGFFFHCKLNLLGILQFEAKLRLSEKGIYFFLAFKCDKDFAKKFKDIIKTIREDLEAKQAKIQSDLNEANATIQRKLKAARDKASWWKKPFIWLAQAAISIGTMVAKGVAAAAGAIASGFLLLLEASIELILKIFSFTLFQLELEFGPETFKFAFEAEVTFFSKICIHPTIEFEGKPGLTTFLKSLFNSYKSGADHYDNKVKDAAAKSAESSANATGKKMGEMADKWKGIAEKYGSVDAAEMPSEFKNSKEYTQFESDCSDAKEALDKLDKECAETAKQVPKIKIFTHRKKANQEQKSDDAKKLKLALKPIKPLVDRKTEFTAKVDPEKEKQLQENKKNREKDRNDKKQAAQDKKNEKERKKEEEEKKKADEQKNNDGNEKQSETNKFITSLNSQKNLNEVVKFLNTQSNIRFSAEHIFASHLKIKYQPKDEDATQAIQSDIGVILLNILMNENNEKEIEQIKKMSHIDAEKIYSTITADTIQQTLNNLQAQSDQKEAEQLTLFRETIIKMKGENISGNDIFNILKKQKSYENFKDEDLLCFIYYKYVRDKNKLFHQELEKLSSVNNVTKASINVKQFLNDQLTPRDIDTASREENILILMKEKYEFTAIVELNDKYEQLTIFSEETAEKNKNLQIQTQEQQAMINKLQEIIAGKGNESKALKDADVKKDELISNLNVEKNDMEAVVNKQQKTIQKLVHEIKELNNKSKHNKKTIIEKDNDEYASDVEADDDTNDNEIWMETAKKWMQ
eukprot:484338_1